MPIHFTRERWESITQDYTAWWAGELKRPLLHITSYGHDATRPAPKISMHNFTASYGLDTHAADIVDVWDYELSSQRFLGDAFPSVCLNFGPGSLAVYLGATLEAREETVWFHPPSAKPIEDLTLALDYHNKWLTRAKDIAKAAMERWQGVVQVGMADLGGSLDVLSTFRPSENLLMDLCLNPYHVHRLLEQVHSTWFQAFGEIDSVLRRANPGYTAWQAIFSKDPYYILQCDFAYMISPEMFDEFVKPWLMRSCEQLTNSFYHLDGVGQLAHLDSLLSIPELKGIQWVPGEGKPSWITWPDVYHRIRDAGKRIQVWGPMEDVDRLITELGSGEGIVAFITVDKSEEYAVQKFLDRHR